MCCFRFPILRFHRPLTAFQVQAILHAENCTLVSLYEHLFAMDQTEQLYYLCQRDQVTTRTVQQFTVLLTEALSSRLQ